MRRLALVGLACTLLAPGVASADWLISPYAGFRFGADTTYVDPERGTEKKKFLWGGSVALLSPDFLGVEADFSYIPGFFEGKDGDSTVAHSRAITLMGNVIVAAPLSVTRDGLRPYVVAGLGLLHANAEDPLNFFTAHVNTLGMNVGGGAIGPLTPRSSVRFEVRQFRSLRDAPQVPVLDVSTAFKLRYWRATVGITFRY